jgi:hypothetical protein
MALVTITDYKKVEVNQSFQFEIDIPDGTYCFGIVSSFKPEWFKLAICQRINIKNGIVQDVCKLYYGCHIVTFNNNNCSSHKSDADYALRKVAKHLRGDETHDALENVITESLFEEQLDFTLSNLGLQKKIQLP